MNCDQYFELMSAALDGELTADARRELDSHLAVCPDCSDLFRILSDNAKAARELDCDVPVGLKDRILNNLPAQEQPKQQSKVIHWKRWTPIAAAACLVLVVTLLPSAQKNSAPRMNEAVPSAAVTAADSYSVCNSDPGSAPRDYGSTPTDNSGTPAEPNAESPRLPASTGGVKSENTVPSHYWMGDQQAIRVSYGATPAPGAIVIGSTESLKHYLSGFGSSAFDEDGNTLSNPELDALSGTYSEDFFRTHRLLCVVVESGSGSNRYEFAPQGLYRDSIAVLEHIPEAGTCDMAAWLLVAEVDTMFDNGDTLEVIFIR